MDEEKTDTNMQNNQAQNNINSQETNKTEQDQEMKIEDNEKLITLKTAITKFLNEHTIYEAIPEDMKK